MKLSAAEMRTLAHLSVSEWRTPYELRESRRVLDALVKKGLVDVRGRGDVGAMFSPRTTIKYRLRLQGEEGDKR